MKTLILSLAEFCSTFRIRIKSDFIIILISQWTIFLLKLLSSFSIRIHKKNSWHSSISKISDLFLKYIKYTSDYKSVLKVLLTALISLFIFPSFWYMFSCITFHFFLNSFLTSLDIFNFIYRVYQTNFNYHFKFQQNKFNFSFFCYLFPLSL